MTGFKDEYARMMQDLADPESVGVKAAERAVSRLNPKPIKTGTYPVLFNPLMARGLLQSFIGAISGGSVYRGIQSALPAKIRGRAPLLFSK